MHPTQYKRNELGLLENVEYIFNEDGSVNWKSMIPQQYLIVQSSYEKEVVMRYNKELRDIDLREIEDKYLLILLGGIKHLLRLRGYKSVKTEIPHSSSYKAVATCTIEFLPNFETQGQTQTYSDTASASIDSVTGIFQLHLETIAANRAFVRAVRNGLGINIVAKDEFDERASKQYKPKSGEAEVITEASGNTPAALLHTRCDELKISFDKLKERAIAIKIDLSSDPESWTDWSSIQHIDAFTLITKINQAAASKKKKE